MIYFKFLQPSDPDFIRKKTRYPFERMYIPLPNDPAEKYCYVEIPLYLLERFFADFSNVIGDDWDILKNKDEFPVNIEDIQSGRNTKFEIIIPSKNNFN